MNLVLKQDKTGARHFPQFDRNPNTGEVFGQSAKLRVAKQTIFHTAQRASAIVLPVVPVPQS
jgi:predicted acyl esterase